MARANRDTSGDVGYHVNKSKIPYLVPRGESVAHATLGHIADAFKDWRVGRFRGGAKCSQQTHEAIHRCILAALSILGQTPRLLLQPPSCRPSSRPSDIVGFIPCLCMVANGVPQPTRLPSYSQFHLMLSHQSSSQSLRGHQTASSPADLSS